MFENELTKKGLDFYVDYKRDSPQGSSVHYFLLLKDKVNITKFLKENEITLNLEAMHQVEFEQERKFMSL